jgi:regulator of nucleoside diphosphate kinase
MLLENSMTAKEHDRANWDALAKEVEAAQVVPCSEIPSDVVTMHSRVRIVDLRTGEQRVFQVVYPRDANFAENKISVLAPIGTALLGYPAGTEITWAVPSGTRRLRIEAVEQQPQVTSSKRCA